MRLFFLIALSVVLTAALPQEANAQFGKLKKKLEDAVNGGGSSSGGNIDPSKLPGPYYKSNQELAYESKSFTDFFMTTYDFNGKIIYNIHIPKGVYKNKTVTTFKRTDYTKKHLEKFLEEGDSVFMTDDEPWFKDEEGKTRNPYCRILKTADNALLFYYGEMVNSYMKPGTNITLAAGYFKSFKHFVLAPNQEILDKWSGEAGIQKIQAFENKSIEHYATLKAKEADKVRMPKAGKMHQNAALLKEITGYLNKKCQEDGSTLKRVVITANDWEVVKHRVTGEILYRHMWGYMADSKPGRKPGECMVFGFYLTQKYDGTKFLEGSPKFDCCSQDPKYGPVILCENIDK